VSVRASERRYRTEDKLMGKLAHIEVERVDGVDRPATGHRWVLIKAEDEGVEKDYAGAARAALEALAKEGIVVSRETAEALHALAALLEMSVEFKSVDGEPEASEASEEDVEKEAPAAEAPEPEERTYTAAEVEELIVKALRAVGIEPGRIAKAKPGSRQPAEQDELAKGEARGLRKGRVSMVDVVFAPTSTIG
jgi:hypothetical protein